MSDMATRQEILKDWAKKELVLFDNNGGPDYDIVYSIYCNFVDEIKNCVNPELMTSLIFQLIKRLPLSPIIDKEDEWELVSGYDPSEKEDLGFSIYQSKRRPSLHKEIYTDGSVIFLDSDRAICIDINTGRHYFNDFAFNILNTLVPVTMPYFQTDKIKIFTELFKAYEDYRGDWDTMGILYFRLPDGQMVEVKKFFKAHQNLKDVTEINFSEYAARKQRSETINKKKEN